MMMTTTMILRIFYCYCCSWINFFSYSSRFFLLFIFGRRNKTFCQDKNGLWERQSEKREIEQGKKSTRLVWVLAWVADFFVRFILFLSFRLIQLTFFTNLPEKVVSSFLVFYYHHHSSVSIKTRFPCSDDYATPLLCFFVVVGWKNSSYIDFSSKSTDTTEEVE